MNSDILTIAGLSAVIYAIGGNAGSLLPILFYLAGVLTFAEIPLEYSFAGFVAGFLGWMISTGLKLGKGSSL